MFNPFLSVLILNFLLIKIGLSLLPIQIDISNPLVFESSVTYFYQLANSSILIEYSNGTFMMYDNRLTNGNQLGITQKCHSFGLTED
jgi:hypothetical protein